MSNDRAWAEIDLNAISANVSFIRSRIGPDVKLMAVVKADGYGHGAVRVSQAIKDASMLGVAIIDEALELRESGIRLPILVLGHTPGNRYREALLADISLTVFDMASARGLSATARELNKTAAVHIKIDTGMNRLGLRPEGGDMEAAVCARELSRLPGLRVEGIFTHFATSDSIDRSGTYKQAERFKLFLNGLGFRPPLIHAANSAAILFFDELKYDMVRAGILIYGLSPAEGGVVSGLKPALRLCARLSHIHKAAAGESVGYGRSFTASRDTLVAVAQIGYADGYARMLGNKADVLIRGERAPIIGTVCMDQLMIDITDIAKGSIAPGEVITLIGADGDDYISADELAAKLGTVNYEIVCGIGKRIPRVYINHPDIE